MTTDFNNCVFTIFCVDDFSLVLNIVKTIYKEDLLNEDKAILKMNEAHLERYLNPSYSGRVLPEFCCWKSANYPDKVFFISNSIDGLTNLCGIIRAKLNCEMIMCHLSNGLEYPAYSFKMINAEGKERIILAYKEDRWVFYEVGDPLPFEDVELYKKRYIRDRLNNNIIYSYLLKNGIDFKRIDEDITESFTVIRTKW